MTSKKLIWRNKIKRLNRGTMFLLKKLWIISNEIVKNLRYRQSLPKIRLCWESKERIPFRRTLWGEIHKDNQMIAIFNKKKRKWVRQWQQVFAFQLWMPNVTQIWKVLFKTLILMIQNQLVFLHLKAVRRGTSTRTWWEFRPICR